MDVKTVDSIDSQGKEFESVFLDFTRGCAENCHIDMSELADIGYDWIGCQFEGFLSEVTAYYAGYLHIRSGFESLNCEFTYVAITDNCCTDFSHKWSN